MTTSHLFIIDPLASLNKELDSSLRLMFELSRRGHEIFTCEPRHLSWNRNRDAQAAASQMLFAGGPTAFKAAAPKSLDLSSFAAIHMRKDPPYDLDYIATTWLLDAAKLAPRQKKTRLYNDPAALRTYNEKLAIFHFGRHNEDVKPALVSSSPEEIMRFIETEAHGNAVLKPLTLFGGRGVEHLDLKTFAGGKSAVMEFLRKETAEGTSTRLVQAFDEAIFAGEVRAFAAFGEPIAWCLKKPSAGNFLANTRMGAKLSKYEPTTKEHERVSRLSRELMQHGVAFIGFDLIGGFVSEINITSPRLLTAPGDDHNYYNDISDLIEKDLGL